MYYVSMRLQNIIGVVQAIIAFAIPDVPAKLTKRIKRENFLLREHVIEYVKHRAAIEKIAAEKSSSIALDNNDPNISIPVDQIIRDRADDDQTDSIDDVLLRKRHAGTEDRTTPV